MSTSLAWTSCLAAMGLPKVERPFEKASASVYTSSRAPSAPHAIPYLAWVRHDRAAGRPVAPGSAMDAGTRTS